MNVKNLRSLFVIPSLILIIVGFSLIPKTASAQNWTLSGTHIYNNNSGYVGIGMTAPQSTLHMGDGNTVNGLLGLNTSNFVLSNEGGTVGMQGIVASSGAAGHRMNFEGIRARGSLAIPTVPILDDRVFTLTGKIFDGTGVQNTAQVTFFVDGTVFAGVAPQRISFRTGATNTASKTENLVIKSTGEVIIPNVAGIGTLTPGGLLGLSDANTYLNVDGSGNLTFTDVVTGTKTLAELATDLVDDADASTTNELQNLFATINGDSGSTTADIQTDTLFIVGSGTVSTSITGDTLTITGSGGGGGTLDGAYDYGGAGVGRTITADSGAVTIAGVDGFLATGTYLSGTIPATGSGPRMMWYPRKAAFRAGIASGTQWDDTNIGTFSTAMGGYTTASGNTSTAMGYSTIAGGDFSTAMGYFTTAGGSRSTAMGGHTTAGGAFSTAMGLVTIASGDYSTAMGHHTTASGDCSTAMGYYTSTNGMSGSFVYGDSSNFSGLNATANHQFMVRASGGYVFYTNSAMSIGAELAAGATSWSVISDVNLKENFKPIDGEVMLEKIANFKPATWNYKSQEPGKFRHYGPMAQDFYAAFGNDGIGTIGDDTTIATADIIGVNFTAINALEKREREHAQALQAKVDAQQEEIIAQKKEMQAEIDAQQEEIKALKAKLADIEVLLNTR